MELMNQEEYEKYLVYKLMRKVALGVRTMLYIALPSLLSLSALFAFPESLSAPRLSAAVIALGGQLYLLGLSAIVTISCISYFFVTGQQYSRIVEDLDTAAARIGYHPDKQRQRRE